MITLFSSYTDHRFSAMLKEVINDLTQLTQQKENEASPQKSRFLIVSNEDYTNFDVTIARFAIKNTIDSRFETVAVPVFINYAQFEEETFDGVSGTVLLDPLWLVTDEFEQHRIAQQKLRQLRTHNKEHQCRIYVTNRIIDTGMGSPRHVHSKEWGNISPLIIGEVDQFFILHPTNINSVTWNTEVVKDRLTRHAEDPGTSLSRSGRSEQITEKARQIQGRDVLPRSVVGVTENDSDYGDVIPYVSFNNTTPIKDQLEQYFGMEPIVGVTVTKVINCRLALRNAKPLLVSLKDRECEIDPAYDYLTRVINHLIGHEKGGGMNVSMSVTTSPNEEMSWLQGLQPTPEAAKHQLYYSDCGYPLLATQTLDKPIITLENYVKWYSIYLLHPDGSVTKVDNDLVDQAYDACESEHAPQRDHNYHPELLYRLADLVGAYVHPQSAEVAMGRWMLEVIELDFYQGS